MSNYSKPDKVLQTIRASDEVERVRSEDRAKINNMFNGVPPLSKEVANRLNIKVNCNFGEAAVLGQHGRRQYSNAFQTRGLFFKVRLPDAPTEKQLEWETFITRRINRVLKKSKRYFELGRSKWASVLLHGIGPQVWEDPDSWCPNYIALEDFRVPTDTETSLRNLCHFSIRKPYTIGELAKKVFGPHAQKGWDKETVSKILKEYHDDNYEVKTGFDWLTSPEKMWELYKQNYGFYTSDAVPTIPMWHFYYLDDTDPSKCQWKLCVVPADGIRGGTDAYNKFIYKSDKPFADDLEHIVHIQFGDLNNKSPFLYHSVRSLGFLLMEPCYWTNLFRCRMLQHAFESFNVWFRNNDPVGKAKAQKVELFDRAFIPEGLSVVPNTERHQIDPNLVETVMGELKQLKQEASASYTQDTQPGQSADETATAVMARVASVNAMMSGLLSTAFTYETFAYQEICRRFCRRNSGNEDVKQFQKSCLKFGIPARFLDVEYWEVEPEIPMGSGNPTMEMAQAQQLLGMRGMYDTQAQQEILHEATIAITGDPRKAERWAPIDAQRDVSDAQRDAEFAFGVLMQGVPVRMKQGMSLIDQIETMLGLMAAKIASLQQSGGMATAGEISGLGNTANYVGQIVGQLAQNPAEKQRVKEYSDDLGKLMNEVKAFAQRLAEQSKQNGAGMNGELDAKIQAAIITAQSNSKIKEEAALQKQRHKETAFQLDQLRKDAQTLSDIEREKLRAEMEQILGPKPADRTAKPA